MGQHLHVALCKVLLVHGYPAQLGCTNGREVGRMREQNAPAFQGLKGIQVLLSARHRRFGINLRILEPIVEINRSLGGVRLEVGNRCTDTHLDWSGGSVLLRQRLKRDLCVRAVRVPKLYYELLRVLTTNDVGYQIINRHCVCVPRRDLNGAPLRRWERSRTSTDRQHIAYLPSGTGSAWFTVFNFNGKSLPSNSRSGSVLHRVRHVRSHALPEPLGAPFQIVPRDRVCD